MPSVCEVDAQTTTQLCIKIITANETHAQLLLKLVSSSLQVKIKRSFAQMSHSINFVGLHWKIPNWSSLELQNTCSQTTHAWVILLLGN